MFEVAERRREAYGINNGSAAPLRERNNAVSAPSAPMADRQLTEHKQQLSVTRTNTVQTTTLNMDSKENVDMAFEINVPSGTDVQVNCGIISSAIRTKNTNFYMHCPNRRFKLRLKMAMAIYSVVRH